MTLKVGQLNPSVNFHSNISNAEKEENISVQSELVSSLQKDEFQKENLEIVVETPQKKNPAKKIVLGTVSAILLIYGSVVLKRKLSKPSFEEIQKCFKEIFEKELSSNEVKALVKKYKEICKNKNTEDFIKQLIEQLKKDYGIEKVATEVNIKKLKDNKLKTAIEHTEYGNANPLGRINIMPRTSRDKLIRSIQEDTFVTGFHEVKHMKQFADAYRANPDNFAEAILKQSSWMNANKGKRMPIEEFIAYVREFLDKRFGQLEHFKPNSTEYKKGVEYINSYANYPNKTEGYYAYRNNLLEKEAWNIGNLARKIYKYTSSIWKL